MVRQWIFDFDDTLVKTRSRVFMTRDGVRFSMTPAQFAAHTRKPGDVFDFSEFKELIDPRPNDDLVELLHQATRDHTSSVAVVSARSVPGPIETFLRMVGARNVEVAALNDADPLAKARWVSDRLSLGRTSDIDFYDDSERNVVAVRSLQADWPHVRFRCHLVR